MMKNGFLIFATTLLLVLNSTANVPAETDYSVVDALRKERQEREYAAEKEFKENPRKSSLILSIAPAYFFAMRSELADGDGWGGSLAVLLHANSDVPDFKFLFGGEMLAFHATTNRAGGEKTTVDTANALLSAGFSYDFNKHFSLGLLAGYGLIGATAIDRKDAQGRPEHSGTMNSVFSIKPNIEIMFNDNFSIYGAYRFIYMAPAFISSATNWGEIEVAASSFELGLRYRF